MNCQAFVGVHDILDWAGCLLNSFASVPSLTCRSEWNEESIHTCHSEPQAQNLLTLRFFVTAWKVIPQNDTVQFFELLNTKIAFENKEVCAVSEGMPIGHTSEAWVGWVVRQILGILQIWAKRIIVLSLRATGEAIPWDCFVANASRNDTCEIEFLFGNNFAG
jgi:hypothetical protein